MIASTDSKSSQRGLRPQTSTKSEILSRKPEMQIQDPRSKKQR